VDLGCLEGRRGLDRPRIDRLRFDMIGKIQLGAIDPFRFESEHRSNEGWEPGVYFPTVALDRLIDHVDELVKMVGVDHVGVGTDLEFLEDAVEGFQGAHETPNLTAILLARGYDRSAVHKILGGNFLRVMETVIGA
jgi:microsomal dipeptidase-like Zn-dependent dipeptidase